MIVHRLQGTRLMKLFFLSGLSFLAFWIWYGLFFGIYMGDHPWPRQYFLYSLMVIAGIVFERLLRDKNPFLAPAHRSTDRAVHLALRQTASAIITLILFSFIFRDNHISRAFLISFACFLPLFLIWANHQIIPFLTLRFFDGNRALPVVLVGEPDLVLKNLEWFRKREEHGLRVIGYIGNGPNGPDIEGIPHLAAESELNTALETHRPAIAVFLESPERCGELITRKQIGDALGIRMMHVWDFEASYGILPTIHAEKGLYFLGYRTEPLESPFNRLVKRIFDVAVSLPVCLVILPPLALFVKIVQRRQSPGKLFFTQERHGVGGTRFRMIKFRTMHENHNQEARQATKGDPRIYPFGAILRKLSLDEFPQFLNVLKGDMSVVGPRPHLPEHDFKFAEKFASYPVRAFVKPGITGLAQVRGYRGEIRNDDDIRNRAESDLHYLENWSFSLDASIVLRTATGLVIPAKNAV